MASDLPPVDAQKALQNALRKMEPSLAISLELAAVAFPVLIAGSVWMVRANYLPAMALGFIGGLACMLVAYIFQYRRRTERRALVTAATLMSTLTRPLMERYFKWKQSEVPTWVHITAKEKVQWLNTVLRDMWPQLNKAASNLITDALTPFLDAYKMGMIKRLEVVKFNLGNDAPRVTAIETVRREKDALKLEVSVEWTTGKSMVVVLKAVTSMAPDLKIKVTDLRFKGVFKIFMRPLVNQLPPFGAVQVSFREQPKIDMDIDILGGEITKIPGMLGMIENIIRTSLQDTLVWPSRIVIPIIPGDYRDLEFHAVGYLEIILLEGRDIPKSDTFSKSDPLVLMYVHQKKEAIRRSSVKMNNMHPEWNELFYVEVEDPESQDLFVRLMDYDPLQNAEFVGSAKIPLRTLTPDEDQHFRITLFVDPDKPNVGPSRGQLHLHVTYIPYTSEADASISPAKAAAKFALTHSHSSKSGNGIRLEEMEGKSVTEETLGVKIADPKKRGTEFGEKGEEPDDDEVSEGQEVGESEKHRIRTRVKSVLKKCIGLKSPKSKASEEAAKSSKAGEEGGL